MKQFDKDKNNVDLPNYIEKRLSSEVIFKGHVVELTCDSVLLSNGKTAVREVVHHNGGAAIVALNERDEVALVRQYRYALRRMTLELPAGKLEFGESPRKTAIRELEEEAACTADRMEDFGMIVPTTGYCTEIIYLFLATGLHPSVQKLDPDEFVDILWVPLKNVVERIMQGEITDSKTVAGILKLQHSIEQHKYSFL